MNAHLVATVPLPFMTEFSRECRRSLERSCSVDMVSRQRKDSTVTQGHQEHINSINIARLKWTTSFNFPSTPRPQHVVAVPRPVAACLLGDGAFRSQ